jgi:4-amino-4-deoxy-L-arabinose transferase-like glycosyltransferase
MAHITIRPGRGVKYFRFFATLAPGAQSGAGQRELAVPLAWLLLLAAAWLLPGLVGHDPWKQDETYVFASIYHLLQGGDWVVPMLAGEPFMEKPPLYYWAGAGLAQAFSPWLPLYDGARLASGLFSAITLLSTGLAARHWWGAGQGRIAVLVLLGCFGLLYESHLMLTDVPMLSGFAIASYGFALSRKRAVFGGVLLGTGVGVGFLAKGLLVPGVIGLTAVLLPLLFGAWRLRVYAWSLGVAFLAALPWLLIWPIALYERAPHLFYVWFWLNNIGRFLGFSVSELGANNETWFWPQTLPWFAFPALPLALLTLWRRRARIASSAPLQYGLVVFAVYLSALLASASARAHYSLPLLSALAVLAVPSVNTLSHGWNRYGDVAARLLFTTIAGFLWAVWGIMIATGHAPDWHFLTRVLPADYRMPFNLPVFVLALAATLAYLASWRWLPCLAARAVVSMAAGITLGWLLFAMLWLPWVDNAKSYRSVYAAMQPHLPAQHHCVESSGLGESERGMLYYFSNILTLRREIHPNVNCDVLLVQGSMDDPPSQLGPDWRQVWQGARPGDTHEHFWLFVR